MINIFSDNLIDLEVAVPYNGWYGDPIPNDAYPRNYTRSANWNGIYSGDYDYLDDLNRQYNYDPLLGKYLWQFIYMPDGGRQNWELTVDHTVNNYGWDPTHTWFFRTVSMKSDFFSDDFVKGYQTNKITDATRPSTKEWGNSTTTNKTHIAITDITRHNDYMNIKVYYNYWTGDITENSTMSGNVIIGENITVSSGVTLTIQPSATLTFNNNSSLIINGILNAQGTSGSNITFDFVSPNSSTQNGIKINQGGTATISYADISSAYNGIKITPSSYQSTIQNCSIHDCYDGLSAQYGSKDADLTISGNTIQDDSHYGISIVNPGYGMNSEPTISDNTITGCSSHGIYLYNIGYLSTICGNTISNNSNSAGIAMYYSSPHLTNNNISNNYNGIGCASSSLPDVDNNDIEGNYRGVYSISSDPFLGQEVPTINGGNNTITGNTLRDLQALSNSTIMAEHNWWGSADTPSVNQISVLSGSTVDYDPWLPNPPGYRLATNEKSPGIIINNNTSKLSVNNNMVNYYASSLNQVQDNFNPEWNLSRKLLYAKSLIRNKNNIESQTILKDIINTYPDSSISSYAMNLLWNSYRDNNLDSLKSFLHSLLGKKQDKDIYGLAEIILAQYDKDNTPNALDKIMIKYTSENIKQMALFGKFLYYINVSGNKDMAIVVLTEIDHRYPGSYISEDAHIQLGDKINQGNKFKADSTLSEKSLSKINLFENYPNPFNPSTIIIYILKEKDKVTLDVYNILGQRVVSLINDIQSEGKHSVNFDGSNLPSGIYIYKLTGTNFSISKKMLLIK